MTVLMLGKQLELGHYRAEFLRSYGIHVIFPETKQQALDAIRAGGYDAAILTYTLDNLTAKELVEMLEQFCPDCPLISITNRRWDDREFKPAETVLDSDPPIALLEAMKRVQQRLFDQENRSEIRRLK